MVRFMILDFLSIVLPIIEISCLQSPNTKADFIKPWMFCNASRNIFLTSAMVQKLLQLVCHGNYFLTADTFFLCFHYSTSSTLAPKM